MRFFTKYIYELKRMLCERITLISAGITILGAGWFCCNSDGKTVLDSVILKPSQSSAILGAVIFSFLAVLQFSRDHKNNIDRILSVYSNPALRQLRRTAALIGIAVVTAIITSFFVLPYAIIKGGVNFQTDAFIAAWFGIFLPAMIISILLSSGLYMLFRQAGAAFVITAVLIFFSKFLEYQNLFNPSYLLFWVQTNAVNFSDLITNRFQIDMILFNRLSGISAALAVWLFGLCSDRRYGRNAAASFVCNCRKLRQPVFLTAAVMLSILCFRFEPVFDHDSALVTSSPSYSSGTGLAHVDADTVKNEKNENLVLLERCARINIDTRRRRLSGSVFFDLRNKTDEKQDLPILINSGYSLCDIMINGQSAEARRAPGKEMLHSYDENRHTWYIELPARRESRVEFSYSGSPKNNGFIIQVPRHGICDEFVDLSSLGVCPWAYIEAAEDCQYSCELSLDEKLFPVSPQGRMIRLEAENGRTKWSYPKGSSSVNIMAARYCAKSFEAGGLNVDYICFSKHDSKTNNEKAVEVMRSAIDYFTEQYGALPYDGRLCMLELPALYAGGFASGNTSAMDETHFNTGDSSDNAVGVLVHEIAHQWWGMSSYPVRDDYSYWSAEGITCFSAYRFMEYYYGKDHAKTFYLDKWQEGWETYKDAFYVKHPESLSRLSERDAAMVMETLNAIGLYKIMPLRIKKAEELLGGTESFMDYLSDLYKARKYKTISYGEFLSMTDLSKKELELE